MKSLTVRFSAAGVLRWKKLYTGPQGIPGGHDGHCGASGRGRLHRRRLRVGGHERRRPFHELHGDRHPRRVRAGHRPRRPLSEEFVDLAVTSTGQVVAVGTSDAGGGRDCHLAVFTRDGTIATKITWPGAWDDSFTDVVTDAFGAFYVTGTYHTAVGKTAVLTQRGSVLSGGGGWSSLWAPAFVSDDNKGTAIAVRGLTAVVAGTCRSGAAGGADQLVLGYVY